MKSSVCLVGWPGAGKTRLVQSLKDSALAEWQESAGLVWAVEPHQQAWVVIDARSPIEDQDELARLLHAGDALVLMFWEAVGLDDQAWWLKQLKHSVPNKPYATCVYQTISASVIEKLLQAPPSAQNPNWPALARLEFSLPKVVLEHLLFVLDSAKQNMGLDIWRVQAVLDTQEYINPVAIEGTRLRWDSFAATSDELGQLRIEGRNLDASQIQDWLQACFVAGHR